MKLVKEGEETSVTDAFGQQDSTDAAEDILYKRGTSKQIYEKLALNEIFIISLQGDTILYVVNWGGTAFLKQATLE